jgi:fatty-acid peroxygenase
MSFMTSEKLGRIKELTKEELWGRAERWEKSERIVLFDEMKRLLASAACRWTGVPLENAEEKERADDLYAMVDAFGAVGPRHWKGRIARTKTEGWISGIIEQIRHGNIRPEQDSPASIIANHRDHNQLPLNTHVAAVELINLLRPIVAIATYVTFGAVALHDFPEYKEKIKEDREYLRWFVQEVRRYYPFGPFLGAIVRKDFTWRGYRFESGTLVLLDIFGTNHDPRIWKNPKLFWPPRFQNWDGDPYRLIPHGGGDYLKHHRCAGERLTAEVMEICFDFLVNHLEYQVPRQNLHYSLRRMPTLPKSGFIMENVRKKPAGD